MSQSHISSSPNETQITPEDSVTRIEGNEVTTSIECTDASTVVSVSDNVTQIISGESEVTVQTTPNNTTIQVGGDSCCIKQFNLTVDSDGQTVFTLPEPYKSGGYRMMNVNQIEYDSRWINISATTLTYSFPQYNLKTKNSVTVAYEIA